MQKLPSAPRYLEIDEEVVGVLSSVFADPEGGKLGIVVDNQEYAIEFDTQEGLQNTRQSLLPLVNLLVNVLRVSSDELDAISAEPI